MDKKYKKILPVLLGADLNCYNVARAFHEEYGVISYAFGRYNIGATQNSRIVNFTSVENFDDPHIMTELLNKFAKENSDKTLLLMGCTDDYVSLIINNSDKLPDYIKPYISKTLFDDITLKENFYKYCEKYSLPYPKTLVYKKDQPVEIPFGYPVIIKPSSSILYWKYPFEGMKKVYRANTKEEAVQIIGEIYTSGYPEKLIIQDMIPGDDSYMYTMTSYSDENNRVRMMCLGHVLLEEHTPKGLGNHAAILTEYNPELSEKLKNFLEDIQYTGYANFDIKYDSRDNTYKLFEVNVRQGRSNYYVTSAGFNIARNVVEDRAEHKSFSGCVVCKNEIYWRYIPDSIVYRYSPNDLISRVKKAKKEKRAFSSMKYKFDLRFNLKRRIFVALHEYRHIGKYKKYYKI